MTDDQLDTAPWRKSSFSADQGNCVETAPLPDGSIAVRSSDDREGTVVYFTRAEINAFLEGAKAGEFDDLT